MCESLMYSEKKLVIENSLVIKVVVVIAMHCTCMQFSEAAVKKYFSRHIVKAFCQRHVVNVSLVKWSVSVHDVESYSIVVFRGNYP